MRTHYLENERRRVRSDSVDSRPAGRPSKLVAGRHSYRLPQGSRPLDHERGRQQPVVPYGPRLARQWSPDGTRIAFASDNRLGSGNREIYTIHPDGTGLTRLTTVTPAICDPIADSTEDPDWSPDGQKIVYVYVHDVFGCPEDFRKGYGLHVMNADGSGDTELVPTDADEPVFSPSWSPDGTKVAYDRSAESFYVNAQGGPETLITASSPPRDWQPILRGYARPKGATPQWASLTIAYKPCAAPNETHAAPLSSGSCAPPKQASDYLTVGTADANGAAANSTGTVRYNVLSGDLGFVINVKDVRNKTTLTDYTGELAATATLRITDKASAPVPSGAGTLQDTALPVTVPCAATASASIGSTCALSTTENTLTPGLVAGGKRAIWQLGQIQVYDGGSDGDADTTGDNTLFLDEGVFVP